MGSPESRQLWPWHHCSLLSTVSPGTTEVTEGNGSKRALDTRERPADLRNRPHHSFKSPHDHIKNAFPHGPLLLMYFTLMFKEAPGRWGTCTDKYLITFPTTPTPSYLLHARASIVLFLRKGYPAFSLLHSSKSEPFFISGDVMCFLWGPPASTWMPTMLSSQKAMGTLISIWVSHRVNDLTQEHTQRLHRAPEVEGGVY